MLKFRGHHTVSVHLTMEEVGADKMIHYWKNHHKNFFKLTEELFYASALTDATISRKGYRILYTKTHGQVLPSQTIMKCSATLDWLRMHVFTNPDGPTNKEDQ